jgi:hypothetical protein
MMTGIQSIDLLKKISLKKSARYTCKVGLESNTIAHYLKPLLIILITVFYVSACGGGSDEGSSGPIAPIPTPQPVPAPQPIPAPSPVSDPQPTPPKSVAPRANAGADQSVNEQTLVTLLGNGTDSDGTVDSYVRTQIAGETVTLVSTDSAWTSFDSPESSTVLTLSFELTVTDYEGATATDTAIVTVNPLANIAPTANAGADQSVNEQTQVMLAGSGTDVDGSVASYRWTQLAGPSATLANPNNASTSFDSPAATSALTLMFQLTITDDEGAATADSVVITFNPLLTQTLTVTGENDGNNFVVSWNDVGADSYRVLFWDYDGNVYGPTTASVLLSITSAIRRLGGSFVVDAYDARGNSVFSSPINVEAL